MPSLMFADVSFRYDRSSDPVLVDATLQLDSGSITAIVGPSGSGKSTFLALAGGLLQPTSGDITVQDEEESAQRDSVSWVFQTVSVLGHRSALDNVCIALLARGLDKSAARILAMDALRAVGLASKCYRRVSTLSGGEVQRVCVARACAPRPLLVLADEPTGQLDRATSLVVARSLVDAVDGRSILVLATHDPELAAMCDRILSINDGAIREV